MTRTVWYVDDDATTVSLSGGGSSAGGATQTMTEGDASTSDTLTVSLSRALVAGERARVPVQLTGLDNGAQVRTARGLRVGANVEYPPRFNDVTMTAAGTGVSYTHVDIKTPPHVGVRWIDFEGEGAQTATITMTPRSGFDDGETGDEVIEADLYGNLATTRARQFVASGTNLGGGLAASGTPVRYFGIDDDDGDLGVVPANWPLLPSGLSEGDKFRLLYVTAAKTDANNPHLGYYDTFARSDILGEQFCPHLDSRRYTNESLDACTDGGDPPDIALVGAGLGESGVDALKPYAPSFRAVVGSYLSYARRINAYDHAGFGGGGGEAIYWVNGTKAADDNADFRDGTWDDQANPRYADGTLARYDSDNDDVPDSQGPDPAGYWTGSYSAGQASGTPSGDSTRCIGPGTPGIGVRALSFGNRKHVQVGYLSGTSATLHTPLGPVAVANPFNSNPNLNIPAPAQNCAGSHPDELRSVYALSGVFTVGAAAQEPAVTVELDAATYEADEGESVDVGVSLSASRSVDTTVQLASASGTAAPGADFTAGPYSVTIPAGSTTATVTIATAQDQALEQDETFTVSIAENALPAGVTAGSVKQALVTIIDDDSTAVPVVSFASATYSAGEASGQRAVNVVLDVSPPPSANLDVAFAISGTATRSSNQVDGDYRINSSPVTVTGGASSAAITVNIDDDDLNDDGETIVLTLTDGDDYDLGAQQTTTVDITDDDDPALLLSPRSDFPSVVSESGFDHTYQVQLNGPPTEIVTVTITADTTMVLIDGPDSGDTRSGSETLTFTQSNWDSPQLVDVYGVDDNTVNAGGARTAVITHSTVSADSNYDALTKSLSVRVADTDAIPTLAISPGEVQASAFGGNGTVMLTLTPKNLSFSGIGQGFGGQGDGRGSDYFEDDSFTALGLAQITLANAPSGLTVDRGTRLNARHDVHGQPAHRSAQIVLSYNGAAITTDQTVTLTVGSQLLRRSLHTDAVERYRSGISSTFTIKAPPRTTPDVEFAAAVSRGREGATVSVRVDASRALPDAYTVSYTSTGGTASAGSDYRALSGSFTMPAGAASAAFDVDISSDNTSDAGETIVLTLTDGDDYNLGSRTVHTVTITESDAPTLVFTRPRVFVAEGGAAARYGVSLSVDPSGSSAALPACDYDPQTAGLPRCSSAVDPVVARVVVTSPDVDLLKVFAGGSIAPGGEAVLEFTRRNFGVAQFVTVYPEPDDDADSEQNVLIGHSVRGATDSSAAFRNNSPYAAGTTTGGVDDGIGLPSMPAYVADDDGVPGLTVGFVKAAGEKSFGTLRVIEEAGGSTGFAFDAFDAGKDAGAGEMVAARVRVSGGVHGQHYVVEGSGDVSVAGPVDDGSRADGAEFIVTFTEPTRLGGVFTVRSLDDKSRASGGRYLVVELLSVFSPDGSAGVDGDPATHDGVGAALGPQVVRVHVVPADRLVVRQVGRSEIDDVNRVEFEGLESGEKKAELTTNHASATIQEGDPTVHHVAVELSKPPKGSRNVVVTVAVSDPAKLGLDGDSDGDGEVQLTFKKVGGNNDVRYRGTHIVGFTAKGDDDFDDEEVYVTFTVSGYGDAHPAGTVARSFAVRVVDDDAPAGVTVAPGALTVTEGQTVYGAAAGSSPQRKANEVVVCLGTDPGEGNTVTVAPLPRFADGGGVAWSKVSASRPNVRFKGGSLGPAKRCKTLAVTGDSDPGSDDEEVIVGWTVTGYPGVSSADVAPVAVTVLDDDAGVRILGREVSLVEGATSLSGVQQMVATYEVVLQQAPTAGATVTVTPVSGDTAAVGFGRNSDGTAVTTHSGLVFTADDWDVPRSVALSAVDDNDADDESVTVTHTVETTGSVYSGVIAGPSVAARVLDDDRPEGIVVSPDGETFTGDGAVLFAEEGGDAVGFDVRLAGRPSSVQGQFWVDVTGGGGVVTADADLVAPGTQAVLAFNRETWWIPQRVWVSAPDETGGGADALDGLVELSLTAVEVDNGTRARIAAYEAVPVQVHVYDDEFAGGPTYTVAVQGTGSVTEAQGAVAVFAVQGDAVPSSSTDVTLNISESGDFVAAGDEGDQTVTFSGIALRTHQVPVVDDEAAEDDGTITATLKPGSGYRVGNPSRASVAVTDDGDTGQSGVTADLSVSGGGSVAEGATLTVTVTLGSAAPSALSIPVRVAASPAATASAADYTLSNSGRVAVAMGAVSGTLTLTAVDDMIAEGAETLTLELGTLPDGVTAGTTTSVAVTINDNDTAGVTVAGGPLTVSEDGTTTTDTYTVRLTSEPLSDVVVTAAAPAGTQVSTDNGATWHSSRDLTFNPSGSGVWSTAQTVHVRGVNDDIDNAGDRRAVSIAHAIGSGNGDGGSYTPSSPSIAAVSVTVADDDTAGVVVAESSGSTSVSENNSTPTDSYTVVLASEPLNDVVVRASVAAGAEVSVDGGGSWGSSGDLTFTPSNWDMAQTVAVRGVDDAVDNADNRRVVEIGHAITDGDGSGYSPSSPGVAAVSVTVNDDGDAAAVLVVESGGDTVVAEDQTSTDSYTVKLGSEPLNDVVVTVAAPAGAEVSVDGGGSWGSSRDLTFNPSGSGLWSSAQTVGVRGTQDVIDNPGDRRDVVIAHSITSGNGDGSRYTTSAPAKPSVSVRVDDDDAKPTSISLSTDRSAAVSEGSASTLVTVTATVDGATRFGTAKTVSVSVAASADTVSANYADMAAVADFSITIPAGAQSHTGTFTISPDNDMVDEADNSVAVTGTVPADSAVAVNAAAPIALADDDAAPAGITLSVGTASVAENGGAQTVRVTAEVDGSTRFGAAQTVAVSVAGHDAAGRVGFAQVSGFSITIPAEAASAHGDFTLSPVDNVWFESDGEARISGTSSVAVAGASVAVANDDAEPSGVTLSVMPTSLGEGGGARTVTVTATVNGSTRYGTARSITVSQAGSGNAAAVDYTATAPAAISLAAGAASSTTTFVVTPVDDSTDEFDEVITVSGSGTGIAAVTEASVTLTDDDDTTVSISASAGAIAESGGVKDVTLTLSRALVDGESVTVPLEVVGVTAGSDYTLALHPTAQAGVSLSTSGSDSAQQPKVTLSSGASSAVVRFAAVDDSTRTQPYALVRYGTGARAPSGVGVDLAAPSDGPVGWVVTDDETGDVVVPQSWALAPGGVLGQGEPRFRLVFVSSAERDASSTDIGDYDAFVRGLLAEGHAAVVPYAGFFTVVGSTSGVHLRDHAGVTGSATMPFYWLGETGSAAKRVATDNGQFRGEWISTETPSSQSVPRDESGSVVSVDGDGYFTGSTAAGARSANPLGSASVTVGYLDHSGAGRAPLGSGQTAASTATRRFYGLSPTFVRATDPVISVATTQTSVAEGAALSFTVSADPVPPGPLTVRLWVSENAGRDMVPDAQESLQTVSLAAGEASKTHTVATAADSADEADAVVTARVLANAGYTVSGTAASASAAVADDDPLSIVLGGGGQTIDEGRTATVTVALGRDLVSGEQVSVPLESSGTASFPADWQAQCSGAGVVCSLLGHQFPVMVFTGSDSDVEQIGTIAFTASADAVHPEADETIDIGQDPLAAPASSGSGGGTTFTGDAAAITIRSVAPAAVTASFGAAAYSVTEAAGSRTVAVPVSLSAAAPSGGLSVSYAVGGTAAAADRGALSGTVSFAQGATTATITVTVVDDNLAEGSETIILTIADGADYDPGATAATTVTITDDDPAPTNIALSVDDDSVGEGDGATAITVTATVKGATRFAEAKTVAVAVAGSGGAGVVGFAASPSSFGIPVAAGARTGTGMFTLTPADDSADETDETVTVRGALSGVTVASATITVADDDTAVATPVTVALSATAGDVAEGAGGAAGRKDVTITLGRALTGSETVTVPLSVQGATAGSDYTFGLHPASQAGVALVVSSPHSAQSPAVQFSAGASGAVLRFSPVDNGARTQPLVAVAAGSSPAPAAGGGATLGAVTGGPFEFLVLDDETGDIAVPGSWALAPSGLGAGDDFRLLFRTSATRDAASADIADYDLFVRRIAGTNGHADIVRYAGFFKAFASTRSASGSTGTTARVHNGLASAHTGHFSGANDVWADGSTVPNAGSAAGTPVWWLNGARLANNYADLCDQAVKSGGGATAGWDVDDPRSETGGRSIASGVNPGQAHQAWTGTGNACEAYDYPLGGDGSGDVSRAASHDVTWALMHQAHAPRAQQRPLYAMSPVFKIAGAAVVPTADFASASSTAAESAGTRNIAVRLVPAPSQSITVAYTLSGTAALGADYTISGVTSSSGTVTVGPSGTAVIPVAVTDDSAPESAETVILTLTGGSGYTVGTTAPAHTLTVTDNDTPGVPTVSIAAGSAVIEGANATFTIAASPAAAGAISVRYRVAQSGRYLASGRLGSGKTQSLSGASATISVPTHNDGADEADGSVTVTLTGGIGLGYTVGSPASASVTVRDDDVPAAQFAAAASDADERSGAHLVRVSLSPVPHTAITVGYAVGGTATRDADFAAAGSVRAAAGASFVDIPVTVIGDGAVEGDETVVLTLAGGAGYEVGSRSTHTVTVADGPAGPPPAVPVVTVAAGPAAIEGADAVFSVSASVPAAVSVRYTVTQHGQYLASGQLGSGRTAALSGTGAAIAIPTVNDAADEASGSVTVALEAGSGYTVGAAASATVAVHDDDRATARFAARTSTVGEGAGAHHVRVLFSTPPHRDLSLGYSALFSTEPGAATRGADFTVEGGSVPVRAGAAFADIPLGIVDDHIAEGPETLTLKLGIGRHYFLGPRWTRSHTVTITDSGTAAVPAADFAVAASTAAESAGTRSIEVRLVPAPAQPLTVSYTLSGTAVRGSDYTIAGVTSNTGTVTVGTSGTAAIPVAITDDTATEGDETIVLTLAAGSGYTVGAHSPAHTLTIAANDAVVVPQLTVTAGPAVDEGNPAEFTVAASPAATGTITVRYTVAQNGQYVASGRLGSGKTQSLSGTGATIAIPTQDDGADEADGSVTVTLEAAAGYTVGTPAAATVAVRDDDVPEAQFAAASSTAAESAGTHNITIRLAPAPAQPLAVSYALSGTATRGSDYTIAGVTSNTGTVTVGTSGAATIPVAITDDSAAETAETITITLAAGAGYDIGANRSHTLTVADNDTTGTPRVSVTAGPAVNEGANATFTVSASPPPAGTVTLRYTVAQNGQYVASGRLGAGKTASLSGPAATITIPTHDDSADEADGSVTVTLTAGNGYTVATPRTATVAVRDDDVPTARFATATSTADESSGARRVRVSLNPAPHRRITIGYTLSGTATRGADYTAAGTVTAAAGATSVDIPVAIIDDTAAEGAETVVLTLTGGAGHQTGAPSAHTLTIADDDAPPLPEVTVTAGPDAIEGADAAFTITATAAPAAPIEVRYTVTQNGQYLASGRLGTGKTATLSGASAVIRIPTLDDTADEASGSVTVTLATGAGYTIGAPAAATVAVHDNDRSTARFAATTSTAAEGAGAHHVRVLFSTPPHRDVHLGYSALYSTQPGAATRRADFTIEGITLLVRAGATHADIPIGIIDDNTAEGPETLTLKLNIGRHYFLNPDHTRRHTITITDND